MQKQRGSKQRSTERVADTLREEILARAEPERFLGSEAELGSRLGVSRSTLRQSVRILEHERVVVMRRGSKGGLYARLPTDEAVVHVASVFLRSQGVTPADLMLANTLIAAEVARLTARNCSAEDRREVSELMAYVVASDEIIELIRRGQQLYGRLGELCGSPTLMLLLSMCPKLADADERLYAGLFEDPSHIKVFKRDHLALAKAIGARDEESAAAIVGEHFRRELGWMKVLSYEELEAGQTDQRSLAGGLPVDPRRAGGWWQTMAEVPNAAPEADARVADALREQVLGSEPGTFLGSEEDLRERLKVSLPTLRQAIRILEHEDVVTVRQGTKGGLYTRVPSSEAVAHMASVFLRSRGATPEDILLVNALIVPEALRLALRGGSSSGRRRLVEILGRPIRSSEDLFNVGGQLFGCIGEMSGSPTLTLHLGVVFALGSENVLLRRTFSDPARIAACQRNCRALMDPILAEDDELGVKVLQRHFDSVRGWLTKENRRATKGRSRGSVHGEGTDDFGTIDSSSPRGSDWQTGIYEGIVDALNSLSSSRRRGLEQLDRDEARRVAYEAVKILDRRRANPSRRAPLAVGD